MSCVLGRREAPGGGSAAKGLCVASGSRSLGLGHGLIGHVTPDRPLAFQHLISLLGRIGC